MLLFLVVPACRASSSLKAVLLLLLRCVRQLAQLPELWQAVRLVRPRPRPRARICLVLALVLLLMLPVVLVYQPLLGSGKQPGLKVQRGEARSRELLVVVWLIRLLLLRLL